ncbi:MAG: transcription factor S [Nanobdellota archaeon]
MMFCPECGSLLKTKQQKNKTVQFCTCGFSTGLSDKDATVKEEVKKSPQDDIEVVDKSAQEVHPLTDVTCPKCGHGKAYFWMKQTRAGDEPETKFYKCESCNHTWRDYS